MTPMTPILLAGVPHIGQRLHRGLSGGGVVIERGGGEPMGDKCLERREPKGEKKETDLRDDLRTLFPPMTTPPITLIYHRSRSPLDTLSGKKLDQIFGLGSDGFLCVFVVVMLCLLLLMNYSNGDGVGVP